MRISGRLSFLTNWQAIFFLLLLLLPMPSPFPGQVRAEGPAPRSCPFVAREYKAQLIRSHLTGTVCETITIAFSLKPPKPPQGFFLSVNIRSLDAPDAAKSKTPEILTGFPETTAAFRTPGSYKYTVLVSLIAKSSCGGVKSDLILNDEVRIDILP